MARPRIWTNDAQRVRTSRAVKRGEGRLSLDNPTLARIDSVTDGSVTPAEFAQQCVEYVLKLNERKAAGGDRAATG